MTSAFRPAIRKLRQVTIPVRPFRKKLREGSLDDKEIEIEVADTGPHMEIMAPPGMEEMTEQIKSMFSGLGGGRKKNRKVKIREAIKLMIEEEAAETDQRRRFAPESHFQCRTERHRLSG